MRIVTIVGARPQFIKAAPVSRALGRQPSIAETMIHTGQHFDAAMSGRFFAELGIPPPARNLGVRESSHARMTAAMLTALEAELAAAPPDAVLVYGDTNSTLAGALAAAKLNLPLLHVEAGLRSYRATQPEEINRKVADRLSALLFCPTGAAVDNLRREGIVKGVRLSGDVMYDMALRAAAEPAGAESLAALGLAPKGYRLATLHRAENTDDKERLAALLGFLEARAGTAPLVLPLHPRTRQAAARLGLGFGRLRTIEPLGYFAMAHLLRNAIELLTDSGGLQKEAYFHRVPCVTLREETEWVETIAAGWNRLWTVPDYLPRREIDDYGDGHSADAIAAAIAAGGW